MAVQYNKLFKMLIDRKMSNNQLAKQAGISLNIITRLKRDEYIAMQTIEKICIALDCGVDDILEFISESQKWTIIMAEGRFIVQFEEKLDVIEEDIVQYSQ